MVEKSHYGIRTVTEFLADNNIRFNLVATQQPAFDCETVALVRGVGITQVLKCMVGEDESRSMHVMLVPGDAKVGLKKVKKAADVDDISLMDPGRLASYEVTVGAISPIQLMGIDGVRFYMDNTVFCNRLVDMSSGDPRAGILIAPTDLERVLGAKRCDIIKPHPLLRRQ